MFNRSLATFAVVCSLGFVGLARAADAPTTGSSEKSDHKLASKDMKFVNDAATGGEIEVALGKVAADKGSTDEVKKFGQQMVDDHSKANDELKALASQKGVDLAKAQEKAAKETKTKSDKMAKLEGAAFDKAYIDDMVKDHEKDVKEFQTASEKASDPDIKAFAAKQLPILQHHLEMAKDAQKSVSEKKKS
jgi:putative membrane protein